MDASSVQTQRARPTKAAKGTRDFGPHQMRIRSKVMSIITDCFKRHGAVSIDTPVFERKEVLQGNYGEGNKEIFELVPPDGEGKEELALRYDLTVPFARYIAAHGLDQIKRYQIAKVYRKDNPQTTRGRYREFYQCDYDIAGQYDLMVPDAECLKTLTEVLDRLKIGSYTIKVNHRGLLDGIFELCGVPETIFQPIASAVDKLDKQPWEEVRKEMIEIKSLDPAVADKLGSFVCQSGRPRELLAKIREGLLNDTMKKALDEMELLFSYLEAFCITGKITFDLSMVRGLSYYTGLILEAVLLDTDKVGSIAGGGRYDNLVDAFKPDSPIPAVGFSVGIERVFTIMEASIDEAGARESDTDILVVGVGGMLIDRFKICSILWDADIKSEFMYHEKPSMRKQLTYANTKKIPWVLIIGEDEIKAGILKLKNMATSQEFTVSQENLVDEVTTLLSSSPA